MSIERFDKPPASLHRVMAMLYRSGISCGLESHWDTGFTAWLGLAEEAKAILQTHSLEEATAWLDQAARQHYPQSAYAAGRQPG
jgi:hypothetical protein